MAESQAGLTKRLSVTPHSALALSGVLQRLQRLEETLEQRRALSLAQGEVPFSRKSIKERGAHLTALFGGRTLKQQPALSDSISCRPVSSACSAHSCSSTTPPALHPPTQVRDIREAALHLERMFLSRNDESRVPAEKTVKTSCTKPCPLSENGSSRSTNSNQRCHRQMTVGKVSAVIGEMAEVLVTLYRTDHRPNAVVTPSQQGSLRREFPQNLGGSDICYFCKKRVYVMERLSADGKFFHRECFKCDFCSTTLRLGAYAFNVEEGKFYCKPHFTYCKMNNKVRKRRSHSSSLMHKKGEAAPLANPEGEASGSLCTDSTAAVTPPGTMSSLSRRILSWPLRLSGLLLGAPRRLSNWMQGILHAARSHLQDNAYNYGYLYELLSLTVPLLSVQLEILLHMCQEGGSSPERLIEWVYNALGYKMH